MRLLVEMGLISAFVIGSTAYFYFRLKASFEQAKLNRKRVRRVK